MPIPPIVKPPGQYTDQERAVIAGYLLFMRAGTLSALSSSEQIPKHVGRGFGEQSYWYYADAESYSRFLLNDIGYRVGRRQMYNG